MSQHPKEAVQLPSVPQPIPLIRPFPFRALDCSLNMVMMNITRAASVESLEGREGTSI